MTDTITTTQLDEERPAERYTDSAGRLWLRLWQPAGIDGMLQLQWVREESVPAAEWARHATA